MRLAQLDHVASKAVILSITLLAFVTSTPAQSQQPSAPADNNQAPAATFTSRAELVLVPAVVTGKGGQHLSGLKADDFTVREDGKPVKIAVFEEVNGLPNYVKPQRSRLPPGTFTNEQENRAPKPLVVLALDNINTQFADAAYARQQLISYLEQSLLNDDKMVVLLAMTRSGVRIIHDFTTDPSVLIAALRRVRGGKATAPDPVEAFQSADKQAAYRHEVNALSNLGRLSGGQDIFGEMRISELATLECLKQIAQAYGGVPGRKALVWVTGGFPFTLTDSGGLQGLATMSADYDRIWEALNNANFSLYPVDARGLVDPMFIGADENPAAACSGTAVQRADCLAVSVHRLMRMRLANHIGTVLTFHHFAEMTGGRAFVNSNDLIRGFRSAVEDSAAYYLLGYYSQQNKPGWHKLKVEVRQQHAKVRARSGYIVAKDKAPATDAELRKMDIRLALHSPMQFSALPLRVRLVPATQAEKEKVPQGKKVLAFELTMPAAAVEKRGTEQQISLTVVRVARDSAGNDLEAFERNVNAKFPPGHDSISFRNSFTVPPGQHTIRLVVRDNFSGRTGSVIAPVTVE